MLHRSRLILRALHAHEILMAMLTDTGGNLMTGASVARRVLAEARHDGLTDEEIIARSPTVLALTAPQVARAPVLPDGAEGVYAATGGRSSSYDGILREALRLRVRWVQEISGRAAWELGERLRYGRSSRTPGRHSRTLPALPGRVRRDGIGWDGIAPATGGPTVDRLLDLGTADHRRPAAAIAGSVRDGIPASPALWGVNHDGFRCRGALVGAIPTAHEEDCGDGEDGDESHGAEDDGAEHGGDAGGDEDAQDRTGAAGGARGGSEAEDTETGLRGGGLHLVSPRCRRAR
jgi:hypothetical protein